jgi:hypothetical protein
VISARLKGHGEGGQAGALGVPIVH